MEKIFALLDCNNFYASCERVFNPKVRNKPVVILSNNDGCIIARSNEAKELGIQMGAPYFEWKSVIEKGQVAVYSSNFSLYGNMSDRVMGILRSIVKDIEVYSVDEAFLDFTPLPKNQHTAFAKHLRTTVKQWTGIPVSVGIAKTKTLAKLANLMAKKHQEYHGVFNMLEWPDKDLLLQIADVGDIWGIGRQLTKFFKNHGIFSAYDLINTKNPVVENKINIMNKRTILELQEIPCIDMEESIDERTLNKSIISSRSFGKKISRLEDLQQAVATYMSRAAEKLRHQDALASYVTVYLRKSYHEPGAYYGKSSGCELPNPTDYTPELIKNASKCLEKLYKKGTTYKKAGVMLTGIIPKQGSQTDFLSNPQQKKAEEKIMKTIDTINSEWGSETIKFIAAGTNRPWYMKQQKRSPHYTTRWNDLLTIKI